MGARQKLNGAYLNGSLILAVIVGWISGSWPVFFVALFVLLGLNLYLGEIRPAKGQQRGQRGR